MSSIGIMGRLLAVALVALASAARAADERAWTVSKSSGEVWAVTAGAQPASLSQATDLKPGDTIRTGRNGRVLLTRGEESILIAPNSAIGIPTQTGEGLSTTIVQQAGSILLEVEKRNVQHFEVETPYLAAVVKGTQFRVSVTASGTSVDVLRGQVQVADFKSGQIAQVMPGQAATSYAQGKIGLALSGTGTFNPVEQGKPRASGIPRLMVPKNGLTAPRHAAAGTQVRTVAEIKAVATPTQTTAAAAPTTPTPMVQPGTATAAQLAQAAKPGVPAHAGHTLRIASPIGAVRLNINRATNGLARGPVTRVSSGRAVASRDATVWSARDGKPSSSTAVAQGNSSDTSATIGAAMGNAATSPGLAAAAAPVVNVVSANSDSAASASGSTASTGSGSTASGTTGSGSGASSGTGSSSDSGNGNSGSSNSNNGNHYGYRYRYGYGYGYGYGRGRD